MLDISIVIPTYNRPDQVVSVVENLFKSQVDGISVAQIIVVEDGSPSPCRDLIEKITVPAPFQLKYVWQENAGPSVARNTGLKNAAHDVVLFIDDDILVEPDMLKRHIEGHQLYPGSVVYGYSPYVKMEKETNAYRFLKQLIEVKAEDRKDHFMLMNSIASGNISVEKQLFADGEMYQSDLRTPAAEEFELMARLLKQGVKVYFNPMIIGWHLQPATIEDKCKQELKYGNGIAEVAMKIPASLEYGNLRKIFYTNSAWDEQGQKAKGLKKSIRRFFSKERRRNGLLKFVKFTEKVLPFDFVLFPLYRFVVGNFLFAGVQEGIQKFKK